MQKCNLIIKGAYILPMDEEMSVIKNGALAITDNLITAIGKVKEIEAAYEAENTIDARNSIVMPGLINTHTHAAMAYFRGLADDLPLAEWLEKYIWPAEAEFVNPDFVRKASELACLEMIKSGVTCFNDMYFFHEVTAEVAERLGIRAMVGECVINFPTPSSKTPDDSIARSRENLKSPENRELVDVILNPHSVYALDLPYLDKIGDLAAEFDVPVHLHLSETRKEVEDCRKKYGLTPTGLLDERGFFNNKTIAVHSVWLSDEDIEIFRTRNVRVSHNPISNMKLASGVAPVVDLLKIKGVTVGLATDGAASNNVLDLFSDMRAAALLHKINRMDPSVMNARDVVKMATREGACVLGLENKIGILKPGMRADIITINLDKPHLQPIYDPYSHLVYCVNSSDVENVIINGKIVMRKGKIETADEENVIANAKEFSEKIS